MKNVFVFNESYCNPKPEYIWSNEHNCYYVFLNEFNLPNVKYYDDGTYYDTFQNKIRVPQVSGNIEIKSTKTNKVVRLTPSAVDSYYFKSPWRYGGLFDKYKRLSCLEFSKYYVTDTGKVYSLISNTYLVGEIKRDYMTYCMMRDDGKQCYPTAHKLVATAFLENPENRTTIDHIDGNKSNNNVDNLRWAWPYENIQYARENGLRINAISDEQIHKVCKLIQDTDLSYEEIAKEANTTPEHVRNIKAGDHRRISQFYDFPLSKNTRKEQALVNNVIDTGLTWNFKY